MSLNLDTDWIKYEYVGTTAYYGYTLPGTSETTSSWAIRQVVGTGSSMSVSWNDNQSLIYSAKWSERVNCFATPSGSLGVTWSVTTVTDSFQIPTSIVNLSWTDLSGVNNYTVKISDQNGVVYNYLNQPFNNTYITTPLTSQQSVTTYQFKGVSSMTYSIIVSGTNALGSTSSTVTVTT